MNLSTIWEILIICCEVILFYTFIHTKFNLQKKNTFSYVLQLLYLFGHIMVTYICNFFMVSTLFTIIFSLCIDTIFIRLFFQTTIFYSIFWSVIYSIICISAEYITLTIPQFFFSSSIEQTLVGGELRIPISCIYIALIATFVFIFGNIFSQRIHLLTSQKIIYTILSILCIGISHYILVLTIEFSQNPTLAPKTNDLIVINLFFITMFISLLTYIYQLGKIKEQNIKYLKLEKQHELEEQQYRILLNTTDSLRILKHDAKHHLSVIKSLIEHNETVKLQEYVASYLLEFDKSNLLISTGNTAIDCILSAKLLYAKQHNITMNYSVIVPSVFPLDDISLSSLLGNLLDNAIESCLRSSKANESFIPWIHFYIKPFQNMILIHSENPYSETLKKNSKQQFISSKVEANHGLGLKRIESLISENNGILQISTDTNIFSVHIIIPLKEETNFEY